MEVVQADLEVAHASVERLEQKCADAASPVQSELDKQLEANTVLREQYDEAQQKIATLESQQDALEAACKQHKEQVRHVLCPIHVIACYLAVSPINQSTRALRVAGSLQAEALKASNEDLRQDKEELQEQISAGVADLRDDDSAEGDEGESHCGSSGQTSHIHTGQPLFTLLFEHGSNPTVAPCD
ncbi:MAG: hypothetical protein HC767_00890 [Akkermansiaceae bacterium]|nr:hypothetical protein [Akkermansiaceae bacterium]